MKILLYISVWIWLFGCATSYQPQGMTGGFTSTQLEKNSFVVTFKGNAYTERYKADDYVLLRSAEIALEHGYKYFRVVDSQKYSKDSSYTTPARTTTNINANTVATTIGHRNMATYSANSQGSATTTTSSEQTHYSSKPGVTNTIICFIEKPLGPSYNADHISKILRSKHGLENK
jgi:hypothetical protein